MLMPSGMHDAVIPIFDNEPTSIISYFLYTRSYQQALNDRMKAVLAEVRGVVLREKKYQKGSTGWC